MDPAQYQYQVTADAYPAVAEVAGVVPEVVSNPAEVMPAAAAAVQAAVVAAEAGAYPIAAPEEVRPSGSRKGMKLPRWTPQQDEELRALVAEYTRL